MQKRQIVAAVAVGFLATPVFAQSSVQISGTLDAAYEHWSNDKLGVVQADGQSGFTNKTSRIIMQGEEDMGNGMKAFFVLEQRLNLGEGANQAQYYDKSWVGLKGGFGEAIFGWVPTVEDTISGGGTIANLDTLADFGGRKAKSAGRAGNGVRYTSPAFGGLKIIAHTNNAEASGVPTKSGVGLSGSWGAATFEAAWERGDTAKDWKGAALVWKTIVLSGAYDFGAAKVGAIYSRSNDYAWQNIYANGQGRATRLAVGVTAPLSTGTLGANIGRSTERATGGEKENSLTHLGVTYQHNLSKRTKIVTAVAYQRKKDAYKNGADTRFGAEIGLRHDF